MKIRIKRRPVRLKHETVRFIGLFAAIFSMIVVIIVALPLFLLKTCDGGNNVSIKKNIIDIDIPLYLCKEQRVVQLNLEDYVAGVVAGEMPSSFEMEALKAQAVAARTYGISKLKKSDKGNPAEHPDAPLCDTTHCQVYLSEEDLLALKGENWMKDGWLRINEAVEATSGEVMYYEDDLVEQPLFHSSSGGKTENSEDVFVSAVPYLRSVESPYEGEAPNLNESITVPMSSFIDKVQKIHGATNVHSSTIKILERSEGGRVKEIQVGNKVLSGRNIRDLFGLRSANFTFTFDGNDSIIFTTSGYGHGVGMSQWGANGMAKAGFGYEEILQHYYIGVVIK